MHDDCVPTNNSGADCRLIDYLHNTSVYTCNIVSRENDFVWHSMHLLYCCLLKCEMLHNCSLKADCNPRTRWWLPPAQRSVARIALFSVVSVCDFVCLSLWLSVNAITPEPLATSSRNFRGIILWSNGRPSSKMTIEGCVCDVLLCKSGAPWWIITGKINASANNWCLYGIGP